MMFPDVKVWEAPGLSLPYRVFSLVRERTSEELDSWGFCLKEV